MKAQQAATCMLLDVDFRLRELLVSSCIATFVLVSFFEPENFNAIKNGLPSGRLTMQPFAQKPIDNLALYVILYRVRAFCTELEANRGVSGCTSHKLNSSRSRNCRNRHGRETAEIAHRSSYAVL